MVCHVMIVYQCSDMYLFLYYIGYIYLHLISAANIKLSSLLKHLPSRIFRTSSSVPPGIFTILFAELFKTVMLPRSVRFKKTRETASLS